MELIVPAAKLQGPRSPDFLAQPLERKISPEERVLNGHSTCTDPHTLLILGAKKFKKNQFDNARIFWERTLEIAQDNQEASAIAQYNLGYAYYELGQPEKTEAAWQQAANQTNDFFMKADALFNLFSLFWFEDKREKAQEKYDTLKALLLEAQPSTDEPFLQADALFYLSGACAYAGEQEEATKYYDMSWSLLERVAWFHDNTHTKVQALKYLVQMAKANGEKKVAQSYQKNITFLLNPSSIENTQNTKH